VNALKGLAWLLLMQSLGEVLARSLSLPFPGPVVGMLLLLLALRWPLVREPVAACADALLQHLSLLFVPAAVGVMQHLQRLGDEALAIGVALVASTLVCMAVSAWTMVWLMKRMERDS